MPYALRPEVAELADEESLAITRMLDKTEPWLMGEAEGVAEAMILELRLRDMVEDKPTEDETSVVPVGVTGVEVNERTADEVVSPTVDATLLLDTVVCDGDPDVTTVGFDVQTPGGVLQVIKPKKQPA
jgi:hypothetical protein